MSRRFKGRHARVVADPAAEPTPPVVLDESNSDYDPLQPDCRKPRTLNTRRYARAEAVEAAELAAVQKAAAEGLDLEV